MKKEEMITCCLNALDLFEVIPNFKEDKKYSRVIEETKQTLLEVKKAIKNNVSTKKITKYLKDYIQFVENTYTQMDKNKKDIHFTHFVFRIQKLIYSISNILKRV